MTAVRDLFITTWVAAVSAFLVSLVASPLTAFAVGMSVFAFGTVFYTVVAN